MKILITGGAGFIGSHTVGLLIERGSHYRKGDISHSYADIQKARKLLNYEPTTSLEHGLAELNGWAKAHGWGAVDLFEKALKELEEKKLA